MRALSPFSEFFVDDAGALSCMRLLALLVAGIILGMWMWGNFAAGQYLPLGNTEAGLIGAAILGKAAQGRFEYGGRS